MTVRAVVFAGLFVPCVLAPAAVAQEVGYRGFVETRALLYPQEADSDTTQAIGEWLARYEAFGQPWSWLRLSGAIEARVDTHHQANRRGVLEWQDRTTRRPALSLRRLSATLTWRRFTADAGKQFIRWGKTDVLNPTDRFAPRDFLAVIDTDFLAVTGARLVYQAKADSVDLVWVPHFTPSRMPLIDQRWTVLPEAVAGLELRDLGASYPGGSQVGARWNHAASRYEWSVSLYDGYNHLPLVEGQVESLPPRLAFRRIYPTMRMYGADAAVPLPWFTVKAEAGYFASSNLQADEYVLYVVQIERQVGEWSLVGGYAGEAVTKSRSPLKFAPDRGLTRALVGRASYTIDVNRSVTLDGVVRENGDGSFLKVEYSQASGRHWRATIAFGWLRGAADDFLGQYRRNTLATAAVRFSF